MSEPTPFDVHLDAALGNPNKQIELSFHPQDDYHSPFDVSEWPDIRQELREEARDKLAIDDETAEEWSMKLASDRERHVAIIGTVHVNDDGTIESWNLTRPRL